MAFSEITLAGEGWTLPPYSQVELGSQHSIFNLCGHLMEVGSSLLLAGVGAHLSIWAPVAPQVEASLLLSASKSPNSSWDFLWPKLSGERQRCVGTARREWKSRFPMSSQLTLQGTHSRLVEVKVLAPYWTLPDAILGGWGTPYSVRMEILVPTQPLSVWVRVALQKREVWK